MIPAPLFETESQYLNTAEQYQLSVLEDTIERGLKTFVDVGTALIVVRDMRLYRQNFGTFEDYCQKRWGMQRRYAYRLMEAAEVVQNVSNWTQTLPATESQARPLTALEPDEQRQVWQQAVDTAPNGVVTAAHVQSVTDEYRSKPHVAYNSGNNEWYTPRKYIEAARSVLGEIDLDPASSATANDVVQAQTYYTAEDDGLLGEWSGRVWMNPPYAKGLIERFTEKLAYHVDAGDVIEAIALVNNATETGWFRRLAAVSSAICFPDSRVRFWNPDGESSDPLQGQAILYMGDDVEAFAFEFKQFGLLVRVM